MACVITSDQAAQVFATQANRLYGMIGSSLAVEVPYISVLEKGTFPATTAAQLTSVIQGRAAPGDSLVAPTFTNQVDVCDNGGQIDQNGTNQYNYYAKIKTGLSEKICFNKGFLAFAGSLNAQFSALQQLSTEYINADVRWELFSRSGVKAVVKSGVNYVTTIAGGYNQIDTPVPAVESDGRLTYSLLQKYAAFMREILKVKTFGSGMASHLRFIGSWEILEALRNDLGAAAGANGTLGALAAGSDKVGTEGLKSYAFTSELRGINLGKDPQPLRANWNGAGYTFVEPEIAQAGTTGNVAVPNPAWLTAAHEVGFLFGKGSFERQVPAPWTGEGKIRFDRQMFGGDIQFLSHRDMTCNLFGDFGVLAYRIGRAFRPIYPWFVMPIIYKRCDSDEGVVPCSSVSGL